jgi:putative MFS transporter
LSAADAPKERFSRYHIGLLALLGIATLYEGFDASMLTLASLDVRRTLDIANSEWGTLYGWTRVGLVASFFLLMCADRFGRRRMLLFTVAGFAIVSGATAFSQTKVEFITWQTLARLFLTAQYGLAIIIAGEELPAALRARGITLLTSLAAVGTVLTAQVLPFFLLESKPGELTPAGNWAHDGALEAVARVSSWLGLPFDGAHWRGLYLVGALPLLLLPLLAAGVRETERYRQVAAARGELSLKDIFREQFRGAAQLFAPRYRRRFLIVALLWNCVYLVVAPSVAYWSIYAREEVGMSVQQVGNVITVAYIFGAFGHLVSGQLVDRVGRKFTSAGFFALGAVAIVMLFHTRTVFGQYAWHISTVFLLNAAIGATHVYASELFPTELRATGYGWSTNFFGRATEFIPVLIGVLIAQGLSITTAITIVGIGPILGAVLIAKYALETRGLTLEQIQEKLDGEEKAVAASATA